VKVRVIGESGTPREFDAIVRIDTPEELEAFRHGGILPYVARRLAAQTS
jgi:aconitate hydratase